MNFYYYYITEYTIKITYFFKHVNFLDSSVIICCIHKTFKKIEEKNTKITNEIAIINVKTINQSRK